MEKLEKDKIRKKEKQKLNKLFSKIPKDKKSLAEGLISQAVFMIGTLAELQESIENDGAIELFEQGAQKLLREHPAAKLYNTMIKNYSTVCKQLFDLLPSDEPKPPEVTEEEELLSFIKKGKK